MLIVHKKICPTVNLKLVSEWQCLRSQIMKLHALFLPIDIYYFIVQCIFSKYR